MPLNFARTAVPLGMEGRLDDFEASLAEKVEANALYNVGDVGRALAKYVAALDLFPQECCTFKKMGEGFFLQMASKPMLLYT